MENTEGTNWSTKDLVVDLSGHRWRFARAHFVCERAFLSLLKAVKHKQNLSTSPSMRFSNATNKCVPPKESHSISIGIAQHSSGFSDTHPTSLSKLVKEKNIDQLEQLGGIEVLAKSMHSDVNHGIDGDVQDVLRRKVEFGSNKYQKPPKSFFQCVYEAFQDLTILILLVFAALSLGFGIEEHGLKKGWYDGGNILVALFLAVSVSAIVNFRQSKQFQNLSKVTNNIQVEVVRKGRREQISIVEVVVGDVVCLKIGDQVAADGLFLEGHSLLVDESSMSGEADHVEVDHIRNPFLYSGTKVADGYAKMLVTSVGMNTTWGETMSTITGISDEQTPQYKMKKLTSAIGKIGLAAGFLVFAVRFLTGTAEDGNNNKEFNGSETKSDDVTNSVVGRIITDAVTTAFSAIPEGLPLVVALTLSYSMKRMMKDQAMVRKLSACETMGSATVICTDKTGTLTLNQMNVKRFWLGHDPVEKKTTVAAEVLELIQHGVSLNTTGSVQRETESSESSFEFSGSPTEKAILQWAVLELNMDMEMVNQNFTVLNVEAFNSLKKKSGVLMKRNVDNTIHAHWKGAAEIILATCSQYYDSEGNKKAIDDQERGRFGLLIEGMAASGLSCIAFACREVNADPNNQVTVNRVPDDNLTLLGIVGLKDPCRPGVKKAVEDCQNAGVNVKMITGDNVFTAKAIATECGLLHQELPDGVVIEGVEFRTYTEEERMERVDKIRVMARSSPLDKLLMVQCLRKKGHVVAVTGDGTNDGLALKEADIGLSMGIQGTEVAKESSDIVILDDNFSSVATLLKWGRCVYNNIQKFIQFHLTVSVAALVINFASAVSAVEVPLTAVQLLWVHLIMGTLGAIALAMERPAKELMDNKPVGRTEPLVTNIMWRNILVQAFYQVIILLTVQFQGKSIFGVTEEVNETLFFNTFVLCQVFNEFNARELEKKNVFEGIHKNKVLMGIIGLTVILQVIMVEFMKKIAGTQRLNRCQWGICLGLAAGSWPIGFFAKCIPVPEKPMLSYFTLKTAIWSFHIEDEKIM